MSGADAQQLLSKARQALQEGRFEDCVRACEAAAGKKRVHEGRRLVFGAYALLGLGHIHQAAEWVDAYRTLSPDVTSLYLLALLDLHARRFEQALLRYTNIVQQRPSETLADRLIERLRKGEEQVFAELQQPGSFAFFLPAAPFAEGPLPEIPQALGARSSGGRKGIGMPGWTVGLWQIFRRDVLANRRRLLAMLTVLVLLGGAAGWWLARGAGGSDLSYEGLAGILPGPPAGGSVIPPEGLGGEVPAVVFANRDEVAAEIRLARQLIVRGFPNRARLRLGRVEESNASFELKERARLLRDMIPAVALELFRDPVSVDEVRSAAYALRGADVLWGGAVTRVLPHQGQTQVIVRHGSGSELLVLVGTDVAAPSEMTGGSAVWIYGSFVGVIPSGQLRVRARRMGAGPLPVVPKMPADAEKGLGKL